MESQVMTDATWRGNKERMGAPPPADRTLQVCRCSTVRALAPLPIDVTDSSRPALAILRDRVLNVGTQFKAAFKTDEVFRPSLLRRLLLVACVAPWAVTAKAEYPDRPLKWIVPAAPAGGADSAVRVVADGLSRRLGQAVVIENRPGGSGSIGLDAIAKAPPDGYTIGTANLTNLVLNRQVRQQLPFNPDRDLQPVARITTQPNLVGVNPQLPVKSIQELIAHAKAHPNQIFYGSSGPGSTLHVATELLKLSTGMQLTHVPYKSSPAANTDLIANNIQLMVDNLSTLAPHVRSGKVRALAVTSSQRSALLPDVPTMAESGVKGFEMLTWGGVVAPAGVPKPVVDRLASEIATVLASPEVRRQLAQLGYDAAPMGPAAFAELLRQENARWGEVVQRAGIKAE